MAFTRFTQSSLTTGVGKYIDADAGRTPIPSVPTIGTATDGGTGTTVSVAFTPGYYPGNYYTVLSNPGSITATGNSSPITVSGLTTGTSYNFSVSATNNTGTSAYSAASNFVTPVNPSSFESIATVTVGSGGSSSIDFNSISSTYTHLQLRGIARTNRGTGIQDAFRVRFNSDSANNYAHHYLLGDGSSASSGANTTISGILVDGVTMSLSAASTFGAFVIDVLDYKNSNKYKTLRSLSGREDNTNGAIWFESGLWQNTNAVTSITIIPVNGTSFSQYSSFALYGIKGA